MNSSKIVNKTKQVSRSIKAAALSALAIAPVTTWAQDVAGAQGRVETFFNNINALLNVASIAVVTIAIIFAGYQIAFNHKRIGDVAPVLIGGFLIGAAAQIAKMLLPDEPASQTTMLVGQLLLGYA